LKPVIASTSSLQHKRRGCPPKTESERGRDRTPKSRQQPTTLIMRSNRESSFETLSPTSSESKRIFTRFISYRTNVYFLLLSGTSVSFFQKRGRGRQPKNSPVFVVTKTKAASSSLRSRRNTSFVAKKKQVRPDSPVVHRQGRPTARKRSNSADTFGTVAKIPRYTMKFDDESSDYEGVEYIPPSVQGKLPTLSLNVSKLKGLNFLYIAILSNRIRPPRNGL